MNFWDIIAPSKLETNIMAKKEAWQAKRQAKRDAKNAVSNNNEFVDLIGLLKESDDSNVTNYTPILIIGGVVVASVVLVLILKPKK